MTSPELSTPPARPWQTRRDTWRAKYWVRGVETARQGFRQLAAHRLRTGLALSGIIVGVAAVVGSLTLLDGVKLMVRASFEKLGGTQVGNVRGQDGMFRGGRWIPFQKRYPVTPEDMDAMLGSIPEIESYAPYSFGNGMMSYGYSRLDNVRLHGTSANYLEIRPLTILAGRFFTAEEARRQERVVVLFKHAALDLIGRMDAIGEEILINGQRFKVVGVVLPISGRPLQAFVPFETAIFRLGREPNSVIAWVKARSGVDFTTLRPAILEILTRRHPGSKPDNYRAFSFGEFQGDALRGIEVQGKILISVALLCLLASGMGILNVFLISVTERTAEIGLRLALGASPRAVRAQFLFESLLLCGLGGGIGILTAQGVAMLFAKIVQARTEEMGGIFADTGLSVGLGFKGIVIGLGLAVATAVIFGSYPAWRASRLDPVTSLRHE